MLFIKHALCQVIRLIKLVLWIIAMLLRLEVLLTVRGIFRVTVSPDSARVDYVSAVLPQDETASLRNAQVRSYYTIYPNTSAFNETKQIQSWNLISEPKRWRYKH